jgi:hypothetical protein
MPDTNDHIINPTSYVSHNHIKRLQFTMTIVTKDIVLDLARHIIASQNATCHNFSIKKKVIFLSN